MLILATSRQEYSAAYEKEHFVMKEVLNDVDKIRKSVAAGAPSLDPFPYGFTFPFLDSFRMIERETIQNVVVAACAVFLICLVILADFLTTVWVVLMVILTDVLLFGEHDNAAHYILQLSISIRTPPSLVCLLLTRIKIN